MYRAVWLVDSLSVVVDRSKVSVMHDSDSEAGSDSDHSGHYDAHDALNKWVTMRCVQVCSVPFRDVLLWVGSHRVPHSRSSRHTSSSTTAARDRTSSFIDFFGSDDDGTLTSSDDESVSGDSDTDKEDDV
jgi:hypothetical protein